jgi:hypothetical protein
MLHVMVLCMTVACLLLLLLLLLLLQLCPEAWSVPLWLRPLKQWTVLQSENTVGQQQRTCLGSEVQNPRKVLP